MRVKGCTKSTSQEYRILLSSGVFHSLSPPKGEGEFRSAPSQPVKRRGFSAQGCSIPSPHPERGEEFRSAPFQPVFSAQGCAIASPHPGTGEEFTSSLIQPVFSAQGFVIASPHPGRGGGDLRGHGFNSSSQLRGVPCPLLPPRGERGI